MQLVDSFSFSCAQCPNAVENIGDNQDKYIPHTKFTSPSHYSMLELVGKLIGEYSCYLHVHFPHLFSSIAE